MPMLFWLPMIFMSAMVELTTPIVPLTPKSAPVRRAVRSRTLRSKEAGPELGRLVSPVRRSR